MNPFDNETYNIGGVGRYSGIVFDVGLGEYILSLSNIDNPYGNYSLTSTVYHPFHLVPVHFNLSIYFDFSFGKDEKITELSFSVGSFNIGHYSNDQKIYKNLVLKGFSMNEVRGQKHFSIQNPSKESLSYISDIYHVFVQNNGRKCKELSGFIKENLDTENGLNSQDEIKQNISKFRHSTLFSHVNNETQNSIMNIVESYVYSPELKPE